MAPPPGPIFSEDGALLGQHRGLHRYTIGQRRGLGLSSTRPLYVKAIEIERNAVIVAFAENLGQREFRIADLSWVRGTPPAMDFRAEVQIRSRHLAVSAAISVLTDGSVAVELDAPAAGVAPGQAAVLFHGNLVLGGGFITMPVPPSVGRRLL